MRTGNQFVFSVSRLNSYVHELLEEDMLLSYFRLEGEISGFKEVSSGHWYFSLKDEMASVSCVMYRSSAARCSIYPQNGMHVQISGNVSLYEQTGRYQVVAQSMRPQGTGSIYQALEQLKAKLEAEGLFSQDRKRRLPFRPKKIAVVTSKTGAVIHDICRVAAKRDPGIPIVLVPTLVQGDEAAEMIAAAMKIAGDIPQVDLVILARGGGSVEDLWCFNSEVVVRAIAECPVPVISAVGHESDVTLSDLASDRRASTPSNAAEIAVPARDDVKKQLKSLWERLDHAAGRTLTIKKMQLMNASMRIEARNPSYVLREEKQRARRSKERLNYVFSTKITEEKRKVEEKAGRLLHAGRKLVEGRAAMAEKLRIRLKLLDPKNVLARGYAIVTGDDGVVTSGGEAARQEMLTLEFADGKIFAKPVHEGENTTVREE